MFVSIKLWSKQHGLGGSSEGFASLDAGIASLLFAVCMAPLWFVLFTYFNLVAFIYDRHDGLPQGATDTLRAFWPEVAGFQLFLQETEYVRLQHDLNPCDPAMAYCLALGLDPGFTKSLKS